MSTARRFVHEVLARDAPDLDSDPVDTAVLLTSELVTNAVLHAGGATELRVVLGDGIRVEVYDASPAEPTPRRHDDDSVAGRGLDLVETLADSYGAAPTSDGGKCTWFVLGAAEAPPSGWRLPGPIPAPGQRVVHLLHAPVRLYWVLAQYNEALLREYALLHIHDHEATSTIALRVSAADRVRSRIVEVAGSQIDQHGVQDYLDISVPVTAADVDALRGLLDIYTEAEELAQKGRLLLPAALPELHLLRCWWVNEIVRQHAGEPPTPWQLPWDGEAPLSAAPGGDGAARPGQPGSLSWRRALPWTWWLRYLTSAIVLTDSRHQIIAASPRACALTGWRRQELVGQRLSRIIPPPLREQHLAGYARHVLTGHNTMLGKPLDLSVWHRDGYEIPVRLTVTKHAAHGEPVFLGRFEPS